jgi:hypothetical protein
MGEVTSALFLEGGGEKSFALLEISGVRQVERSFDFMIICYLHNFGRWGPVKQMRVILMNLNRKGSMGSQIFI